MIFRCTILAALAAGGRSQRQTAYFQLRSFDGERHGQGVSRHQVHPRHLRKLHHPFARIVDAAWNTGREWYAAVCLAGDAGLRVGEVKALRWREDADLVAGTITVNQQIRHGLVGTPKGRTRRVVPMTPRLRDALKALEVVRTGNVLCNAADGSPVSDSQARDAMYRICKLAGLPERGWHLLRHSFGTQAAMLGVNPWRLQSWMGHKRIDETMIYVHVAENHRRAIPEPILESVANEHDPDRRVLKMLAMRVALAPTTPVAGTLVSRGSHVAAKEGPKTETAATAAV